jgi:hypothetical protein
LLEEAKTNIVGVSVDPLQTMDRGDDWFCGPKRFYRAVPGTPFPYVSYRNIC